MQLFYKRPLLMALTCFLFFSVIGTIMSENVKTVFITILAILTALSVFILAFLKIFKKSKGDAVFNATLILALSLGALSISFSFFNNTLKRVETLSEQKSVVATIEECIYRADYTATYTASIESIGGQTFKFKAELVTETDTYLKRGDRICADMTFSPFEKEIHGFDERAVNISDGILVCANFSNAELLTPNTDFSFVSFFNNLRADISRRIDKSELECSGPLIKALLIGDKSDLEPSVKLNFKRLGISHILAISGTHFTIILGIVTVLLFSLGLNKKVIYFILVPLAFFYMGLSGFSYSVCRAGIMAILTYIAFLGGRSRDSYTALFLSTAIIIVFSPYAVMSIALWLSFSATFTILVLIDIFRNSFLFKSDAKWYFKLASLIILPALLSVCVSFATLPIISMYFGEISIATPIANIIIVPIVEIFLFIIPFTVLLSKFGPLVAVTEWLGKGLLEFTGNICKANDLLISIRHDFVIAIAIVGLSITFILLAVKLKHKFLILLPCTVSIIAVVISVSVFMNIHKDETSFTYYTTGINDGIVLLDNNRTLCIDLSTGGSAPARFCEYISDTNYSPEISGYMLTHYHTQHVNQFKRLLGRTKIQKLYLPSIIFEDDIQHFENIEKIATEFNVPIELYSYDIPFEFENCTLTVFSPQVLKRSSHESISLEIQLSDKKVLYLGSSFAETSFNFKQYVNNADYIIFGQHHPKTKKEFSVHTRATMIFGSEEIFNLSNKPSNSLILENGSQYNIILK